MDRVITASRLAGLEQLHAFVARAGRHYSAGRNTDEGPGQRSRVSELSPWIRHRLVLEEEVARAVLAQHSFEQAEKFLQEVCWRTYWKGWLQQRPSVWYAYCAERDRALADCDKDRALASGVVRAINGETGIEAFDAWARELAETGYLHNHARMWVASIWIFTLRLPWTLGADWFLRHLRDGDAASNTLSWRWVAGLQTRGKHYLARADNIHRYTDGRFHPVGQLDEDAQPLDGASHPEPTLLPSLPMPLPGAPTALLITDEDLHPESWPMANLPAPRCIVLLDATHARSPLAVSEPVARFAREALADAAARAAEHFRVPVASGVASDAAAVMEKARAAGCEQLVGIEAATGPVSDLLRAPGLAGTGLHAAWVRRDWDAAFWPHARKGFFALKKRIPDVFHQLGLSAD